ncbi:MAG: response regulator transcription factor [Methylicorpusculum sp.]|uniref:response regulator transcription factor n=1 Tax=Methylicorpusculum sp. TaxID=2713644 RepID=UPI002715B96A|nr:response regulator transcription factor [Methylicorpusculum sp.]MDO8939308.1 response regulator transcription factor [Methylicorpusculum sp.]MDP2177734.1 response regulator transcription factor [Methylicorpusculum sp.]MDP2201668.1 response regulator transcription factor [Methylicorpusculum sp.]MDP3527862.1 response regulator transcription factor [Methylicorpusculum sp.]MDZ4153609.1 response regulator transcription factor [Methylicorpusculum sp.]
MSILLVEDDRKASGLLVRGLAEEGFAVDPAYSAEEAEQYLCMQEYRLIILDWFLPGKSGVAWCEELRQQGERLPILMLTARDALQDRVEGLNAGADDYLIKPFAYEELLARTRALLRRSDISRQTSLKVADLTLDMQSHRATRGELIITLTQKEYAILEILMRRAGRVVSRNNIAESLWNNEHIGLDNLIDAHIRNLRRKIDRPGNTQLIHTIRGRGFRLTTSDTDDA